MDRLAFRIYQSLSALLAILPIEWVFRVGEMLGLLAFHVAWPYRRLVLSNLTIAFGAEKSRTELRALARQHFATLGANILSSLKIPTLSPYEIQSLAAVEGIEHFDDGVKAGRGFVMVISHIGNWELFAQLSPILFPCKTGTIYQRLGNALIDAEIRANRATLGLALFERKEGFGAATKFLREGGAVGVLIDQHAGDAGLWCPFFNRLASTSTLAATLARRANAVLLPAAIYTDGHGCWRMVFSPPIEAHDHDVETVTALLNQTLETQIRRRPADWFWVHDRWKTPKPQFLLAQYKRGIVPGGRASPRAGASAEAAAREDARPPNALQPFRVVIRASNWLGDALMSVPAVRAIKCGRPDAHVTILTPAKLGDFWKTVPEVDDVISITGDDTVFDVARKIRQREFEAAVIFPNSLRTALEPWLAHIPRRVGYPGHRRTRLLNQPFREKKKKRAAAPQHHVHHYLALADFIGADVRAACSVQCGAFDGAHSQTLHAPRSTLHVPILGLCPGAEYGPAKRWLPERFAEVMRALRQRRGCGWKIFGVAKDREVADEIIRRAEIPCVDFVGKTTLAELITELRTCDALLTNDTGTMHLAAHLGVPVIAIFGSTEPALTGPLGAGHRVLRHHVECSPCFLRECPIDFRCMRAVTSEEALAAIEAVLDARPALPLNEKSPSAV